MIGGLIQQKRDGTEFKLGSVFNLPDLKDLPKEFQFKPLEIKNQERDDGCVGCAVSSASELQENRIQDEHFSYLAGKEVSPTKDAWGLTLKEGLKGAVEFGTLDKDIVDSMKLKPVDFRDLDDFPSTCRLDALNNKKKSYFEVVDDKGHDVFDDIRRSIYYFRDKRQGVVFGLTWGYNLKDNVLKDIKDKGYGHCMLAIGFKDNYLIVQQSAGKEAGDNGIILVHRDVINHEVPLYGGAFMLIDMTREEAEKYINEGKKYKGSLINRFFQINVIQQLIKAFQELLSITIIEEKKVEETITIEEVKEQIKTMNEKLYDLAVKYLGTDASPRDFSPDNLACAESVSTLLKELFGSFPIITGTWTLREQLKTDNRFERVTEPVKGCIIMSATGTSKYGKNTTVPNGHVGIIGDNGKIYSNNYRNGVFSDHMTLDYWNSHLVKKGGYPIEYYSLKN